MVAATTSPNGDVFTIFVRTGFHQLSNGRKSTAVVQVVAIPKYCKSAKTLRIHGGFETRPPKVEVSIIIVVA